MRPLRSELSLPASVWNTLHGANTAFNCATERSYDQFLTEVADDAVLVQLC